MSFMVQNDSYHEGHEVKDKGIKYQLQHPLPVEYKGMRLDCGYRVDVFVEGQMILELKSVEEIKGIHEAQLLTYMKLAKVKSTWTWMDEIQREDFEESSIEAVARCARPAAGLACLAPGSTRNMHEPQVKRKGDDTMLSKNRAKCPVCGEC